MLRVDRVGYIEMRNPRSGAEYLGRLGLGLWNQVGLCLVSSRVGSLPSLIYRVPELSHRDTSTGISAFPGHLRRRLLDLLLMGHLREKPCIAHITCTFYSGNII